MRESANERMASTGEMALAEDIAREVTAGSVTSQAIPKLALISQRSAISDISSAGIADSFDEIPATQLNVLPDEPRVEKATTSIIGLVEDYVTERERLGEITTKTRRQYEQTARLLVKVLKDDDAEAITGTTINRYRDYLGKLPKNYGKSPADAELSLEQLLARAANGAIDFRYHTDWLAWENTFPMSLSLPLRKERYSGQPVIAVFDNLLPDSDGMRRQIAERLGAGGVDAYSLLTALGHDCVGALQFLPDGMNPGPVGAITGEEIDDVGIGLLLRNLAAAPLGLDREAEFRISVAGAQEKTALLKHNGRWLKPIGMTATTHILKPAIGRLPNGVDLSNSVENEYLCLKLVEALGLPVAKTEMADFDGARTLVVERFDRSWLADGRLLRLPQEDCCQALGVAPTAKYEAEGGPGVGALIQLFKGSDAPEADVAMILRAQIIFWLLGATDGHAKNFSLLLRPGGRFRMTPLYDVLSTEPSIVTGQVTRRQAKLAMSLGRNNHCRLDEIAPRHIEQTAALANVDDKTVRRIFEELADTGETRVREVITALPADVPEAVFAPILAAMEGRFQSIRTHVQGLA